MWKRVQEKRLVRLWSNWFSKRPTRFRTASKHRKMKVQNWNLPRSSQTKRSDTKMRFRRLKRPFKQTRRRWKSLVMNYTKSKNKNKKSLKNLMNRKRFSWNLKIPVMWLKVRLDNTRQKSKIKLRSKKLSSLFTRNKS